MFTIQHAKLDHDLDELTRFVELNVRPGVFDGISIYPDHFLFQFHNQPSHDEITFITELTDDTIIDITEWKRNVIWKKIQAERDRRKAGGVKVGDHWFHSDDSSRIQQLALVIFGANLPSNIMWKTMSGAFVEMTPTLIQQIFQASAAQDITIFTAAETHKAQMMASPDPEAYDFSGGWPDTMYTGPLA